MFYWKDNDEEDLSLGYEGRIYETGKDEFALALFRDLECYTWFWELVAATPREFVDAINSFILSSDPSFSSDCATIVCTNLDDHFNYRQVPIPLKIVDGALADGTPLAAISSLRIDVPGPAERPEPTRMRAGEESLIPPLRTAGVSFWFTSCGDYEEVNLGMITGFTPTESIVDFYARTIKRTFSPNERSSLVAMVARHSKRCAN